MLKNIWLRASNLGLKPDENHPERRYIVFANQVVFVMGITVALLDIVFFLSGVTKAGLLLLSMVFSFAAIASLMHYRQFSAGRLFGLGIQNLNLFLLSVFIGYEARVIDFLIITTLLPLVLFNIRERKKIFACALQSFLLFSIYHFTHPYTSDWVMDLSEQIWIYRLTIPVKFILVLVIVYILVSISESEIIQHQKQSEDLIEQRNFFTSILNQIPVDIAVFDSSFKYIYANKHAIENEADRKWVIGKNESDYAKYKNADDKYVNTRQAMFRQALKKGSVTYLDETLTDTYGNVRSTIRGAAPIKNTSDEVSGIVSFSIDITERKEAEDKLRDTLRELERVNEGLKQFAYVTSHDLKTPLRNISTYLQLLKRRNKLDHESNEMVDAAVNSVKHLNQLITDIFLYTTTETNKREKDIVDLNEILKQVENDTSAIIRERNAQIVVPASLPKVYINKTQAMHVFSNLVNNALKYNKSDHPTIELKVGKINGYTEFRLKDNGIGIDPQYKDKIFEIFKRLHSHHEYEGTGIGLAICKKIIEGYGGNIRVESEPGIGSEFVFTLPTEQH